jgi:lipopolysaccharide/colanic/teichoic acid biosynthesis glycosyltransferase
MLAAGMGRDLLHRNMRFKAGAERLAALALVAALLPIALAIAAAISIEAMASGERPRVLVGETRRSAGRTFRLLKFRTFRVSAWREHLARARGTSVKALERRPEALTRIGRVLKRIYLDELPQLLNVVRGEMALVGPRPYFDGDWQREPRLDIPARRLLRAGLVGPYQALKGRVSGLESVNQLDSGYLDHLRSASLLAVAGHDLALVARSLATVLRARGL